MEPIVETRHGKLRGLASKGVHVFRGVPFARPPLAERRFRAPEPPVPWAGVRDATAFGAAAPQPAAALAILGQLGAGQPDADCLYLNVYAPATPDRERPVLVWIHGGAFTIGSGSQPIYDARELARRGNVVVVTINYRLGALGFLFLDECGGESIGAVANPGLLDQVAALRWVSENIEAFGGAPDDVTIFGQSAGGMSVGTLLGLPAARGLFRRAVAQSGACQALHTRERATRVAETFLAELGLPPGDLAKLRELPVARLLDAQAKVLPKRGATAGLLPFQPVIDGETLPRHPLEAVRDGSARDVSLLVGTTRDEWRLFGFMDPGLRSLDAARLLARVEKRVPGVDASTVVDAYRESRDGRGPLDPAALFFAIETDRVFRIPAIRLAEAHAAHSEATFMYLFTWASPFLDGALGACHAIDLPFVFGTLELKRIDRLVGASPEAKRLSGRVMDAWLAFARAGAPQHRGLGAWPDYRSGDRHTMILGRECSLEVDPSAAERRIWEGLL